MPIRTKTLLSLVLITLVTACGEEKNTAPEVDDQTWDELSPEQRQAHLQAKLDDSLELMRETEDAAVWRASAQEATRALSMMRGELMLRDRAAYTHLEAQVQEHTENPPAFVPPEPLEEPAEEAESSAQSE